MTSRTGRWRTCGLVAAALIVWAAAALGEVRSGRDYLTPALQALQDDELRHPGMLWVEAGAELWRRDPAPGQPACEACHGADAASMRGVATRYPAVGAAGGLLNLELRIEQCRTERQNAPAFGYESADLLSLSTFVAHQSRGLPMTVRTDGPAKPFLEAGQKFYFQRQGQMNLSCAQCHDDNAGRRLRGDVISSGVGTGYPAYRLEWNSVGSLHRRLRACSLGVRATQFDSGSPEYLNLELYLAARAQGLPVETPAIRR
ncbi:MAG: Sulfur oxidation protein SoxA [uncultured Microvirga sp.]|uniref:SoxAX cytochrome complex subunit A n=1 Tax=uncultured Microvirga sp. TaxID=412392 RepID=A0A6J4MFW0_9HYPH|nr:MAG: Sulfur oxidation protein SoxA [uncultured Microvirga sp.]